MEPKKLFLTTVTGLILGTVQAHDAAQKHNHEGQGAPKTSAAQPKGAPVEGGNDPVTCYGINSCKGQGTCHGKVDTCGGKNECATSTECGGRNSCKGKGMIKTTKKECLDKGGKVASN